MSSQNFFDANIREWKPTLMLEIMVQDATKPAIPPLLAVGAVHHHLISNGLRMSASIVIDTAQCFSTHHFACLIGYGARYVVRLVLVPPLCELGLI